LSDPAKDFASGPEIWCSREIGFIFVAPFPWAGCTAARDRCLAALLEVSLNSGLDDCGLADLVLFGNGRDFASHVLGKTEGDKWVLSLWGSCCLGLAHCFLLSMCVGITSQLYIVSNASTTSVREFTRALGLSDGYMTVKGRLDRNGTGSNPYWVRVSGLLYHICG